MKNLTDDIQNLMGGADTLQATLRDAYVLIAFFLLTLCYEFVKKYTNEIDSKMTMDRYIKTKILQHRCEVQYKCIENFDNFNEKLTFAETQAGKQVAVSLQAIVNILQSLIQFVSVVYLLVNVNVWIVVVILITSIPAVLLSRKQKDELYYVHTQFLRENSLALHYYYICCGEYNLTEVRHLGIYDYLRSRWRGFCDSVCNLSESSPWSRCLHLSLFLDGTATGSNRFLIQ